MSGMSGPAVQKTVATASSGLPVKSPVNCNRTNWSYGMSALSASTTQSRYFHMSRRGEDEVIDGSLGPVIAWESRRLGALQRPQGPEVTADVVDRSLGPGGGIGVRSAERLVVGGAEFEPVGNRGQVGR